MKKQCIAAFILFLGLLISTSGGAADLEDGFMGYRWGDDVWKYDGLVELYKKGNITFYSNPGQSYVLEGVVIGDVIYGFYEGKFYAVYINIDSLDQYDLIERNMRLKYGLADNKTLVKEDLFTYRWKYKDVKIKLKKDMEKGNMKLAFYHEPTSKGLERERIVQELEASERFFPLKKNKDIDMVPFMESWEMR
jgi:hypothetical protein